MRYPDFYCIGAQKAGTTWLHDNLALHPAVWMPFLKEIHYFNWLYLEYQRRWIERDWDKRVRTAIIDHVTQHTGNRLLASGLLRNFLPKQRRKNQDRSAEKLDYRWLHYLSDIRIGPIDDKWYGNIFSLCPNEALCGEMTPEYSILPEEGIEHILRLSPSAKFILLLRDPVDRDFSHLRMMIKAGILNSTADEMIAMSERKDVYRRSDYLGIIKQWESMVGSDRLFIGFFDEIATNPQALMKRCVSFLGLEFKEGYFPNIAAKVHKGTEILMPAELGKSLIKRHSATLLEMARRYPDPCRRWAKRHGLKCES